MPVIDLTFQSELIQPGLPVIVDNGAAWCGQYTAILPIRGQLASEYAQRVKIAKPDADQNSQTGPAAGGTSLPILSLYQNGERANMPIGAHPRPIYTAKIEELLA